MRYVVALAFAACAVLGTHWAVGIGTLPRPWGALGLGTVAGVTLVVTLIIWEVISPSEEHDERDRRLAVEEAARAEQQELRRAQRAAARKARRRQPGQDE